MGRFCFLVSEGGFVYGVSSFHGSLVPLFVTGATASPATNGNVGIALSAGQVHGFAASTNTWASLAVSGTPVITQGTAQPAFVAIQDGMAISMFSGHTGAFATLPAAPSSLVNLERYVAVVRDATSVYGSSALLGTFAQLP